MLYNKHNLAVAKFAATGGAREELTGVLFTKEKTAATDSFRLLEVSVDSNLKVEDYPKTPQGGSVMRGCKPFIVPAKALAEIKIPKSSKASPVLESVAIKYLDDKRVDFITTNLEAADVKTARCIDAKFPDYSEIFPKHEPLAEMLINGELLAELVKVMSEINKELRIKFYGKEKPVVIECGSATQKARGMIMPIRDDR